jgi:pantothenate kinase
MALPGQPQTFAIDSCRDMLNKLEWEIEQLQLPVASHSPQHLQYGCYNAAATASMEEILIEEGVSVEHRAAALSANPGGQVQRGNTCQ